MSHALAHTSWEEDSIVFLDPHEPFIFREIIHDILRTGFCVPNSIFLVERVELSISVEHRGYRTVRLLLSDGHSCIQALLKGEAHGYIQSGQVYEGCYIRADEFELEILELDHSSPYAALDEVSDVTGGQATRRKPDEVDVVVYLLLKDFVTVGWDKTYMEMLDRKSKVLTLESNTSKAAKPVPDKIELEEQKQGAGKKIPTIHDEQPTDSKLSTKPQGAAVERPTYDMQTSHAPLDIQEPPEVIRIKEQPEKLTRSVKFVAEPATTPRTIPATSSRPSTAPRSTKKKLRWIADDPSQPMKLTPLSGLGSLPQKANWAINVLAVITSLSPVVVSNLKPFNERTAELADPTTDKRVRLTVFHHPETFTPRIGSVVLLPAVRNHTDGGLKRYYVEGDPEKWWFEEPSEYGWCKEEVARLRRWWDGHRGVD